MYNSHHMNRICVDNINMFLLIFIAVRFPFQQLNPYVHPEVVYTWVYRQKKILRNNVNHMLLIKIILSMIQSSYAAINLNQTPVENSSYIFDNIHF